MVMNHKMLYFSVILNNKKTVVTCDSSMSGKQKVTNVVASATIFINTFLNDSNNFQHPHMTNPSPSVILI